MDRRTQNHEDVIFSLLNLQTGCNPCRNNNTAGFLPFFSGAGTRLLMYIWKNNNKIVIKTFGKKSNDKRGLFLSNKKMYHIIIDCSASLLKLCNTGSRVVRHINELLESPEIDSGMWKLSVL